jgi:hypothetical protein
VPPLPAAIECVSELVPLCRSSVLAPTTWLFGVGGMKRDVIVSQLRRRREAAWRSVPLDCGCRDPLPCSCTEPALTEHALDAWRDAAEHVLASGRIPLVPLEVRRALARRPADRRLAELLHRACGQVVA